MAPETALTPELRAAVEGVTLEGEEGVEVEGVEEVEAGAPVPGVRGDLIAERRAETGPSAPLREGLEIL